MKLRFAFATLAIAVALVATVAFVPSVRAQVGAQVAQLFVTIVSGPITTPIDKLPGYLPEFDSPPIASSGAAQSTDPGSAQIGKFEDIYQKGDRFLVYTKSGSPSGDTLPKGKATSVNGHPAVLNTGLSGKYVQDIPNVTGVDQNGQPVNLKPITINYTNANKLTWIVGSTRFEMLSNLSVDELLKIAAKLATAK